MLRQTETRANHNKLLAPGLPSKSPGAITRVPPRNSAIHQALVSCLADMFLELKAQCLLDISADSLYSESQSDNRQPSSPKDIGQRV